MTNSPALIDSTPPTWTDPTTPLTLTEPNAEDTLMGWAGLRPPITGALRRARIRKSRD